MEAAHARGVKSSPTKRVLLVAGAALFALTLAMGERAHERRRAFPLDEDVMYLPKAGLLEKLSLGHTELAADILFIRALNYFAIELNGRKDYSWFDRHLETIRRLDADFRAPYLFGARSSMYNGLPITNEMIWRSSHYLEAGLARFPRDWEMAFMLGCNYINELQTTDARQREGWRSIGGQWIRRAAAAGGGPPWLPNLAATIMTEEGQLEAALRYLEEAYLTTDNEESRRQIGYLLAAKRRAGIERLTRARDAFAADWRATLPYAPADLYVVVGRPPSPRLDLPFLFAAARTDDGDGDKVAR